MSHLFWPHDEDKMDFDLDESKPFASCRYMSREVFIHSNGTEDKQLICLSPEDALSLAKAIIKELEGRDV